MLIDLVCYLTMEDVQGLVVHDRPLKTLFGTIHRPYFKIRPEFILPVEPNPDSDGLFHNNWYPLIGTDTESGYQVHVYVPFRAYKKAVQEKREGIPFSDMELPLTIEWRRAVKKQYSPYKNDESPRFRTEPEIHEPRPGRR